MLQSKAGYIDARPLATNSSKSSCYARPDHTSGHELPKSDVRVKSVLPPTSDIGRRRRHGSFVPIAALSRCSNVVHKRPVYSITSSAAKSRPAGTVRSSSFAVLRLTAVSYLVGACTGRSAGLSPRKMRST